MHSKIATNHRFHYRSVVSKYSQLEQRNLVQGAEVTFDQTSAQTSDFSLENVSYYFVRHLAFGTSFLQDCADFAKTGLDSEQLKSCSAQS